MNNIYVNCGGNLMIFESKKETMDFFEECIMMCEGSERERIARVPQTCGDDLSAVFPFGTPDCVSECSTSHAVLEI